MSNPNCHTDSMKIKNSVRILNTSFRIFLITGLPLALAVCKTAPPNGNPGYAYTAQLWDNPLGQTPSALMIAFPQ